MGLGDEPAAPHAVTDPPGHRVMSAEFSCRHWPAIVTAADGLVSLDGAGVTADETQAMVPQLPARRVPVPGMLRQGCDQALGAIGYRQLVFIWE